MQISCCWLCLLALEPPASDTSTGSYGVTGVVPSLDVFRCLRGAACYVDEIFWPLVPNTCDCFLLEVLVAPPLRA